MNDADIDPHVRTLEGLPWYVTGRLEAAEATQIRAHLEHCAPCRLELEREVALQALVSSRAQSVDAAAASFARLEGRIRGAGAASADGPGQRVAAATHSRAWLRVAAAVAGAAVIGGLLEYAWVVPHYRSATSAAQPAPSGTRLRLVLAPDASVGEWAAWLSAEGAQVVAGPSASGAWTVSLPTRLNPSALKDRLARWRSRPGIELVEPVGDLP